MTCDGCYSKEGMQNREGCLYMYKSAYDRLYKECPCLECLVKGVCNHRYKKCSLFREFLNSGIVVETAEAIQEDEKGDF